eukprot:scaffold100034_cov69-Phaeocystis_antarctica.AAC.1
MRARGTKAQKQITDPITGTVSVIQCHKRAQTHKNTQPTRLKEFTQIRLCPSPPHTSNSQSLTVRTEPERARAPAIRLFRLTPRRRDNWRPLPVAIAHGGVNCRGRVLLVAWLLVAWLLAILAIIGSVLLLAVLFVGVVGVIGVLLLLHCLAFVLVPRVRLLALLVAVEDRFAELAREQCVGLAARAAITVATGRLNCRRTGGRFFLGDARELVDVVQLLHVRLRGLKAACIGEGPELHVQANVAPCIAQPHLDILAERLADEAVRAGPVLLASVAVIEEVPAFLAPVPLVVAVPICVAPSRWWRRPSCYLVAAAAELACDLASDGRRLDEGEAPRARIDHVRLRVEELAHADLAASIAAEGAVRSGSLEGRAAHSRHHALEALGDILHDARDAGRAPVHDVDVERHSAKRVDEERQRLDDQLLALGVDPCERLAWRENDLERPIPLAVIDGRSVIVLLLGAEHPPMRRGRSRTGRGRPAQGIGLGLGIGTGLGLGSDHLIPRLDVRAPLGPARDRTEDRAAGDGEACRHEAQ